MSGALLDVVVVWDIAAVQSITHHVLQMFPVEASWESVEVSRSL